MKGLFILGAVFFVVAGVGIFWLTSVATSDPGTWVAFAFGDPFEGKTEIHVPVDMGMIMKERPRVDERGDPMYEEWVLEHFSLRDEAGDEKPFTRIGHSLVISDDEARSNPEFYIKSTLKVGTTYTLEYRPKREGKARYRHTFTVPTEKAPMVRLLFEPVEDK
jgi:hypothetical protein